jgi:hypothetical protein
LLKLLTEPVERYAFHLHWSWWRRAHQAGARHGHIAARARERPVPCQLAPTTPSGSTAAASRWAELSDEQWRHIQPLLPARSLLGRPPAEPRLMVTGVLWILQHHASWRELPAAFGSWRTIYGHYRSWRQAGLWPHLLRVLVDPRSSMPEVSL